MQLHIIARGKIGNSPEAQLVERYMRRIKWPQKITQLPDIGGKIPPASPQMKTILLDEKGTAYSSIDFANIMEKWRDHGVGEARFMIGAADGFSDDERRDADLLLSFGTMTWPHLMARAMLAEQLFRATSILANHPYHREG